VPDEKWIGLAFSLFHENARRDSSSVHWVQRTLISRSVKPPSRQALGHRFRSGRHVANGVGGVDLNELLENVVTPIALFESWP